MYRILALDRIEGNAFSTARGHFDKITSVSKLLGTEAQLCSFGFRLEQIIWN